MKRKILVIGGSGFVGSRLIEIIRDCFDVKNLDKQDSHFHSDITLLGDIRDQNILDKVTVGVDTIILLAAEHRDDVSPTSLYYDVNVQGTRNVLNAMEKNGVENIIFTSSVAVYGLNKCNPGENHPHDPFNDYGLSKWQAEEVLREWFKHAPTKRSLTIIRPTVIFGERNRGNVYNLLKQIASGRFAMVGAGNNCKSMAYIGNIIEFIKFKLVGLGSGYNVYNYVDKPDLSMNQLVMEVERSLGKKIPAIHLPYIFGMFCGYFFDFMAKLTGKKYTITSVRVKKFCATTQFDATKVHSSGFIAPYTLSQGLEKTLQYEFIHDDKDHVTFFSE